MLKTSYLPMRWTKYVFCDGAYRHISPTLLHCESVRKFNNEVAKSSKTTSDVASASENINSATLTSSSLSKSNAYD